MHFSLPLASLLSTLPLLVLAHGNIPGAPKIFGRRSVSELKSRHDLLSNPESNRILPHASNRLVERQSTTVCGPGVGSCAAGLCCSASGYCGTGTDFCAAPDCQFNHGPACDANTTPPGASTSSVTRTKYGIVPYGGAGVFDCVVPGTIAITYDDGPYIYTTYILDVLKQYNARATFFITGNNLGKGEIDNAAYPWSSIIKRMYAEGHQIASHTWSHQDLSTLTTAQRQHQMYANEMALRNILGFFPTYMRPPYSSCTVACQTDMARMGYHVTYFDLDTEDYLNDSPTMIRKPKNNFLGNISSTTPDSGDWLVIGHDIHEQTAHNLTAFMLQNLLEQGYKAVTVGECLGDPQSNWYRSSNGNLFTSSTPAAAPTSTKSVAPTSAPANGPKAVSTDATCGGQKGFTCLGSTFGNCCSRNGWCGSTSAFCGTGCLTGYGTCGIGPSMPIAVSGDGSCGNSSRQTCKGSTFGSCCSVNGYCGNSSAYCGGGCQGGFGTCG